MSTRRFLTLFLLLSAVLTSSSCTDRDRYVVLSGYAQGGVYNVKFNLKGVTAGVDEIRFSVDSILTLVDTTLSGYNKGSVLSRLNEGREVVPNRLLIDIYRRCHELYVETGGCVDVASGPLFDIWGFGFKTSSLPSDELVRQTMEASGMDRLIPDMELAVRPDGMLSSRDLLNEGEDASMLPVLNFNAVAQGYTSDMVASYLYSVGVRDMLVDIGEIFCDGLNPSRSGWSVGVDRPVDGNETPGEDIAAVWTSDGGPCGIVTSGNYRKFYYLDGRKYAHTVDPRTGYPVQHQLLSATVKASDSASADAYATYCMVLGLDESRSFIESRPDLEGYLIYADGDEMKEWASAGFNITSN